MNIKIGKNLLKSSIATKLELIHRVIGSNLY